jgi:putative aminopeptidase FrvX
MSTSPKDQIIEKTLDYLDIPAVVGHEMAFMTYLFFEYKKMGLNIEIFDNLLCVYGEKKFDTILSAHLDRHGLISIGDGEYAYAGQYVREIKYGQNDRASQKLIERIQDRFVGEEVYAYEPRSLRRLGTGTITACSASINKNGDAIFNIDCMKDVPINTPIAYARPCINKSGFLKGQIDNALSLATIHTLYQNGYQGAALLTCEEEIGKSWSHMQDFLTELEINTQKLLILDTSPYSEHRYVNDGIVVLRTRDKSAIFNIELAEAIADYCNDNEIPFHFKDQYLLEQGKETEDLGSTELGRLIMGTAGQWSGASIQIPTLEYHTSFETTTHKAIENYYRLLSEIVIEEKLPFLKNV